MVTHKLTQMFEATEKKSYNRNVFSFVAARISKWALAHMF